MELTELLDTLAKPQPQTPQPQTPQPKPKRKSANQESIEKSVNLAQLIFQKLEAIEQQLAKIEDYTTPPEQKRKQKEKQQKRHTTSLPSKTFVF